MDVQNLSKRCAIVFWDVGPSIVWSLLGTSPGIYWTILNLYIQQTSLKLGLLLLRLICQEQFCRYQFVRHQFKCLIFFSNIFVYLLCSLIRRKGLSFVARSTGLCTVDNQACIWFGDQVGWVRSSFLGWVWLRGMDLT